ncbi:MAG: S1C family serine protease [Oscillospiraceae bacterium]
MDNNFDENKTSVPETEGSAGPDTGSQHAPDGQTAVNGNIPPMQQPMPQYIPQQNMPNMQGMPNMQYNPMGAYPPPVQQFTGGNPPKQKKFSGGCFWGLISFIIILIAAVVLLSIGIAKQGSKDNGQNDDYSNITQTQNAEQPAAAPVVLSTAEKPVLEEEYYRNEETGLLTTVGVAKAVLPSQVQVKIFDEIPYAPVSTGSGIIITSDGYILTNAHVVDGAKQISVLFYDGTESEAEIVGMDKKSDLAVIIVNRTDLVPAQIGTSSSLVIGEEVALAGAGGGFENTVTYGHVTGLGREINTDYISSSTILCIQSDAALNPGNSGGALVNMYGQVVGVAVALMNHEKYENIGFSIAIDDAVPIAEDLIAYGYVTSRTKVGISYVSIGDATASEYGLQAGLCIMSIDPSCDVANAGLKPYDIITEMDGVRVYGAEEIADILSGKVPGDKITLTVLRKKITGDIEILHKEITLAADTSSISGYSISSEETDYFSRDIIN